jgi:hypothetical protein
MPFPGSLPGLRTGQNPPWLDGQRRKDEPTGFGGDNGVVFPAVGVGKAGDFLNRRRLQAGSDVRNRIPGLENRECPEYFFKSKGS